MDGIQYSTNNHYSPACFYHGDSSGQFANAADSRKFIPRKCGAEGGNKAQAICTADFEMNPFLTWTVNHSVESAARFEGLQQG